MAEVYMAGDVRNGTTFELDNSVYKVVEFQHVKPGKGSAFVKMKLRNLKTGSIVEDTYNTNIKIEKAHVDKKPMQYLYNTGDDYVFMDTNTYEQVEVPAQRLEEEKKYLKENLEITINFYEGEIIGIDLPEKIEFEDMRKTMHDPVFQSNNFLQSSKERRVIIYQN